VCVEVPPSEVEVPPSEVVMPPLEVQRDWGPPLVVAPSEVLLPKLVVVAMCRLVRLLWCCWVGLALAHVFVGEPCQVF
jgi:hypothetical protein